MISAKKQENNKMGNFRNLKKRDTKGTFHAKMGTIKDRNIIRRSRGGKKGKLFFVDVLENYFPYKKQKILRRGGKNTQKNYT